MKKYRITVKGTGGTVYSFIDTRPISEPVECGSWDRPFPNAAGAPPAFGIVEMLFQDDECPQRLREEGAKSVSVREVKE
jgi:hypothetical protein